MTTRWTRRRRRFTRPERRRAWRTKSRMPEGPPTRSQGPMGHRLLVYNNTGRLNISTFHHVYMNNKYFRMVQFQNLLFIYTWWNLICLLVHIMNCSNNFNATNQWAWFIIAKIVLSKNLKCLFYFRLTDIRTSVSYEAKTDLRSVSGGKMTGQF